MPEKIQPTARPKRFRVWLRRFLLALVVVFVLVAAFHRPLLHTLGRSLAIHFAAKENLKLDLTIEGTIFTGIELKNIHAAATGPSAVQSLDVGEVRVEYSLIELIRGGTPKFLKNVEVHRVNAFIEPGKAFPIAEIARKGPPELPGIFPERINLSDINCIVRTGPDDLVIQDLNLSLDPRQPGKLSVGQLLIPHLHTWTSFTGKTSYLEKNLIISDLVLDKDTRLSLVNLDASKIASKSLKIAVDGTIAQGSLSLSLTLKQTVSSLETDANIAVHGVAFADLTHYFGAEKLALSGEVKDVSAQLHGTLDVPKSWSGGFHERVDNLRQRALSIDRCEATGTIAQGIANLQSVEIVQKQNSLHVQGTVQLPETVDTFGQGPTNLHLTAVIPDLKHVTADMAQPVSGDAHVGGTMEINKGKMTSDLSFEASNLSSAGGRVEKVVGTLKATKVLPRPGKADPYFTALTTDTHLDAQTIRFQDYALDRIHLDAESKDASVVLSKLLVTRKADTLSAGGRYLLPLDIAKASVQPATIAVSFVAAELGDYWVNDSKDRVTGSLNVSGEFAFKQAAATGALTLLGKDIRARNLAIPIVSAQASVANNVVYLNDLTARLNDKDYLSAWASVSLEKPFLYRGKVVASIANLATFEPVLAATGNPKQLAGALNISWEGSGQAAVFKNTGHLTLRLEKGRVANLQGLQANVEANYSPEALDVPIIYFGNDKVDFQAIVQAKGSALEVTKIQIDQGKAKYASGYISMPLVWKNIGTKVPILPSDGKVLVTFQSENLDIKKIFDDLGIKPPATGLVNVKVDAQGTFAQLAGKVDLQLRDVRVPQQPKLEPASVDLALRLENDQVNIAGKVQQAKIQPLQFEGHAPLNVSKLIQTKKLADDTPITAKVHLPKSSVNFVRQFVPAIRDLDGDMAVDVAVNGTIARPVLSGSADMNINVARFTNSTLPALNAFKARLNFNRDTLVFERFGGELAGGPFSLSGRVTLPKLTEPNLDLRLKADSVLLARSDTLTVRADADLKLLGPLKSASVTGSVSVTNSQFLKNIDLVPIGLPGRPAPQPPASTPNLSFPQPPLRDWKFDVAIKSKDPFLLRGNLANGGAIIDLHLIGTGLQPGLTGFVRLENVEATLPFSRLQINQGFVYFDPSDSLNPRIDLQGTSQIRDYIIHVYVYGTSSTPEVVFTSEPPLPQEEIISLLATGTTRQELAGSGDVLAGRALMLVGQQLYRKIFKKGAPTKSNPVFDRLQVDVGNVDPRTGQQSATARFKINENVFLIGDLAVGGDFRGLVKYLIRFR